MEDNINNDFDEFKSNINQDSEIDITENNIRTKTLQIEHLISGFEYRLKGYIWKSNAEKLLYVGGALVGDYTIKEIMFLLQPFSREIILISHKRDYPWQKQVLRTCLDLIALITTAKDIDSKNMKIVFRCFYNLFLNIGDIITNKNSQDFIKEQFGMNNPEKNLDTGGGILP